MIDHTPIQWIVIVVWIALGFEVVEAARDLFHLIGRFIGWLVERQIKGRH